MTRSLPVGRFAAITLAALLLTARAASADICIAVDVHFGERSPSPVLLRAMHEEAAAIWAPYGVSIDWSANASSTRCDRVGGSFDVVVDAQRLPAAFRVSGLVLGTTRVRLGPIEHAPIHIDYEGTERVLHSVPANHMTALLGHPDVGSGEMGRALGRLLSHEIGHVLLAAPYHQPGGLMRRSFLPEDLVGLQRRSFTLNEGEISRLRAREDVLFAGGCGVLPHRCDPDRPSSR